MKKRILIYTGGSIPTKEWDEISQEINKMQDFECVYRIGDSPESNIRPEYLCFKKLNELLQIKDSFVPNENFYKEVVPTFIDMFSRISFRGMAANRYVHYTYHEYINICVTLAKIFYQILINNKIDIIILNTIPYTGPDYLLTKIAEKLNIKVLFFYQSLIPNRFFPMTHINNLGKFKFKNLENEELNFNLPISRGAKPSWFYMQKKFKPTVRFRFQLNQIIMYMKFYGFRLISSFNIFNKYYLYRTWYEHLNFLIELVKEKEFKYNKSISSIESPDLDVEYVYFPLHMQPEQSTSSLCSIYVDQLLAIEHLCEVIPNNWVVYAKENPKQNHFMRSNSFYERLSTIKQCKYISNNFDTFELMKKSKFVATISGTAGLEAIVNSKPVINFGKTWYNSLPGVYEFSFNLDPVKISQHYIDESSLNSAFSELMQSSYKGVLSSYHYELLSDAERVTYKSSTFHSIKKILPQLFSSAL